MTRLAVSAVGTVAVACSGGNDSLALLHATLRAGAPLGLRVVALHVHHGLQPAADGWVDHLERLWSGWAAAGQPLHWRIERLSGAPAAGESIEAWARQGRRQALIRMAHAEGATLLLLAQHRRDQAETVLLQMLRGAGEAGLAAMPRSARRGGIRWARPWLDASRASIEAYGALHGLQPLQDPSNDDRRLARNRLRHEVWPALTAAFPHAEAALAQSARRQAQTDRLLVALATADLRDARTDDPATLRIAALEPLDMDRRRNLLRLWWHETSGGGRISMALLERLAALEGGRQARRSGAARFPAERGFICVRRAATLSIELA